MGFQLSGFQFNGLSAERAYLKISEVRLQKMDAFISIDIFADKATRDAGGSPLQSMDVILNGDRFAGSMGAAPGTPPEGFISPISVEDIALTQAYLSLQSHPDTQALLTGAVAE